MSGPELPAVIDSYQRAHDQRDTERSIASFDSDATVVDENQDYVGIDRIRWWLDNAAAEFTFTRTLIHVEHHDDDVYVVHNHLSGNFPGGEADLRHRYQLHAGLIHRLEIAP